MRSKQKKQFVPTRHKRLRLDAGRPYNDLMNKATRSPTVTAYLRFLQLASAVQLLPGMDRFDANEKALFEEIMLAWSKNAPLTVRQAIGLEKLGSPATLHKRVARLRKMELVEAACMDGDRRTKFLIPTSKGLEYAGGLGKACAQGFQLQG